MVTITYRQDGNGKYKPTDREIELMHKLFDEEESFERDDVIGFFTDYCTGFFNQSNLEEYDKLGLKGNELREYYDEEIRKSLK